MRLRRKLGSGFMQAMGVAATAFLVLSLIFPNGAHIKVFYYIVSLEIPVWLFAFLTFELKLFSKKLWVRRTIVVTFGLVHMIVMAILFGYLQWDSKRLIAFGITIAGYVVIEIFAFYVIDTVQKRNLEDINQKLAEQNKEN